MASSLPLGNHKLFLLWILPIWKISVTHSDPHCNNRGIDTFLILVSLEDIRHFVDALYNHDFSVSTSIQHGVEILFLTSPVKIRESGFLFEEGGLHKLVFWLVMVLLQPKKEKKNLIWVYFLGQVKFISNYFLRLFLAIRRHDLNILLPFNDSTQNLDFDPSKKIRDATKNTLIWAIRSPPTGPILLA